MKDFIAKYLTKSIGILIVIGLCILGITNMNHCSVKKTASVVAGVTASEIRQHITDSLKKVSDKHEIAVIDSINALRASDRAISDNKLTKLKVTSGTIETKLNKELAKYKNDTTAQSDDCDSVITEYNRLVVNKDSTINELNVKTKSYDLSLTEMNKKYDIQKAETDRCDNANVLAQKNIGLLTNELKKKDNWWNRNEKWMFLGAGVVGGYLLFK